MQHAACMPHPATDARGGWSRTPGTMDWTVSRCGICHARLRQLVLGGCTTVQCKALPSPPAPTTHKYWPGLGKCSKTITISPTIQVRSFISSLYVIARWDPKWFSIPGVFAIRHSGFPCDDCTLPWLSPDGLSSYLFSPPMCANDWPVIAWQLHLSITGVLGVAWSGLNWRYLHSLSEPCCKSKPQTGNVVNCNSYFQFRHCMSPIKFCLLRKQFQFRSPWLAFLHPLCKYLSFEKETLSELGTVIPSEHQYNLSE